MQVESNASRYVDTLAAQIKEEKSKGKNADYNKIAKMLLERLAFINIGMQTTNETQLQALKAYTRELMGRLQANYKDPKVPKWQKGAAVLKMAGGLASGGASGVAGLIAKDQAPDFYTQLQGALSFVGGGSSAVGSATGEFSNVDVTKNSGERDELNKLLELNKALEQEVGRAAEDANNKAAAAERAIKDMEDALRAAVKAMVS